MNGIFSIELAHQHQQDMLDYANQSRIAIRAARTRRLSLAARFGEWRRAHTRSAPAPDRLVTTSTCGSH